MFVMCTTNVLQQGLPPEGVLMVQSLLPMPPKVQVLLLLLKLSSLKKRGRKPGPLTKLAMPRQGVKVALRPSGDQ
jgi:hypothetical protein